MTKTSENHKDEAVATFLCWSIFTTAFCCFPFGIAAVVYSRKAKGALDQGNTEEARWASGVTKRLNIVGSAFGIIIITAIIIYVAVHHLREKAQI
ncbi:proline rich transmembrane protein 1B-like [Leucoraja erinacea]|uniref:proline rich transmembrane protein 1B-like n=1 Tax=Leucoraja erinaceus TaxID=7782 RepID=UPI0024578451|nr:proline rich transmembrane protein 1B-like [Leucoraja erinacea]